MTSTPFRPMEVNQILMMPVSFGGWQSHDDLKKNNLICYYTFDNYAYFSGNAPMTSDAQKVCHTNFVITALANRIEVS